VTIVRKIGEASRNAARVEVPFEFIAPAPDRVWTASTQKGFDIPIGRSGATKRQILALGKGTAQHALIAGKTGSGKSTLMHALITNLAMTYRPEEAELYLIDFKKGVEFKMYAEMHLPHARVIAIESEREFGLSVLQRLDGILRERGDRFRALGVNDFPSFRESHPGEPLPRILLVVDEFQEFFVEDDKLAQEAGLLVDRLVRQGRAFGVHVILGSQTLGGGYSLPRSTIDQMAVRIALQCSEADAQLILSKDNSAARLLTRPGEAIYNDANGLMEGNNPFQVVWLSEDRRESILQKLAERSTTPHECLVFGGSAAAELAENRMLRKLLASPSDTGPATLWLGDAIAIKDPTAAVFRPQSGANLLLIGQSEEAALAIAVSGLVSLAARYRDRRTATVLDGTPDDSEFADTLRGACSALRIAPIVERADLGKTLGLFAAEVDGRLNGSISDRSPRFLFIHGMHRLRELRKAEEDFGYGRRGDKAVSPGDQFATILREGPAVGIHVVAWCDSVMNLTRAVERQGMREFTLRVLFQMSANDSAQLIDTPAASKLGRTRALFVEEGTERPEKFRPYGLASADWLRGIGAELDFAEAPDSTEPERPGVPMQADDSPLALATE
jgi:S-DNA-T family DNA segregation ATPase FtsK/SpoIIIE